MTLPESLNQEQQELLAGSILNDLTDDEANDVQRLLAYEAAEIEFDELEWSVAALHVALASSELSEIPRDLRVQVVAAGKRHFTTPQPFPTGKASRSTKTVRMPNREKLAWLVAAACCVLLAFVLRSESPTSQLDNSDLRQQLISDASDSLQADWGAGTTPFEENVSGDVVWSTDRQQGYMRFIGMPINDPTVEQYQLWIIDPARDDEPIDGGVFDIAESGEVIVPIHAKLEVLDPKAFAITIEKPGGVVVSTQERLPLLASVQ